MAVVTWPNFKIWDPSISFWTDAGSYALQFLFRNSLCKSLNTQQKFIPKGRDLGNMTPFLPRDAIRKRGLCCGPVSVCLSVCLSVYLSRSCILSRRLNISSNFFVRQVARSLQFFFGTGADTQFQREPLHRGRKIQWLGKFCDYRLKSPSISETVRDRPMVAMER